MGMFDLFTQNQSPAPAPAPQQGGQPAPPGNIPAPANGAPPEQGVVPPEGGTQAGETNVPDSPLAPFEKLWEPVPNDPNAPEVTANQELKAEDVQKVMQNANFTPQISAEQQAAITAGGEGAQEAFNAAMNSVAQQVMVQATLVGNKLAEKQVEAAIEQKLSDIPQLLRDQGSAEHLKTANPLFDNPAVKPVVEATRQQLLQKFPNATHQEITTMTQDFILAMGESFAPKPETPAGEQDWTKFLS